MNNNYNILHLEGVAYDAELAARELRKGNINFTHRVVDSEQDYLQALNEYKPDIVLCDHSLSNFNSTKALKILKAGKLNIPFILITATLSDEEAIKVLKDGADDYILKDRLKRLPPAVKKAIENYRLEGERQTLEKQTEEKGLLVNKSISRLYDKLLLATKTAGVGSGSDVISEYKITRHDGSVHYIKTTAHLQWDEFDQPRHLIGTSQDITPAKIAEQKLSNTSNSLQQALGDLNKVMNSSLDVICSINKYGKFVNVSAASETLWGYTPTELIGKSYNSFVYREDQVKTTQAIADITSAINMTNFENYQVHKNGTLVPMVLSARWDKNESMLYCVAREATEKKHADASLLISEQRFKDLVQSGSDLICILNPEGNYLYVSPNSMDILGFSAEEFIGKNAFSFMHPDDKEIAVQSFSRIGDVKKIIVPPIRFRHKDGSWRWLDSSVTNFIDNPAIAGIVINSRDVTDRKLAQDIIRESEARLTSAQAVAKVGSWEIDLLSLQVKWSTETYRILEVALDTSISHQTSLDLTHPDDKQRVKAALDSSISGQTDNTIEHRIVTSTGKVKTVEEKWRVVTDEEGKPVSALGTVQDITERKKAEEKLSATSNELQQALNEIELSERKYRQIVETAQEGIWLIDEHNKTTFVNSKMCEIFGYGVNEMLGKEIYDFMDEKGGEIARDLMKKRKQGMAGQDKLRYISKSGKAVWTNVSANPLFKEDGSYQGALAMVTDITLEMQHEREILKSAEERELLVADLTRTNKDLKQFSFITSHNFRAPLSNLIGLLSIVEQETLTDNNRDIFEMFKNTTQHLSKTINDLSQILIIKNNEHIKVTKINIRQLLSSVKDSLADELNDGSNYKIDTTLKVEEILFNKSYLESVLVNLISNAIKYKSDERLLRILVHTFLNQKGEIVLTVQDNGLGIDLKRHQENLFGLYQRFHSNTNGSGLGLYLVKSQIMSLGGTIEVESEVGKGTTFIITLKDKGTSGNERSVFN